MRARLAAAAGLLGAFLAAPTAAATVSGYGVVGPDPASDLGFSRPVLTAAVVGTGGGTVSATRGDAQVSAAVPAGLFSGPVLVSLVDLTDAEAAAALLPADVLAGRQVRLGVGLGLQEVEVDEEEAVAASAPGGAAPGAVTLTVTSASLDGGTVYLVSGDSVAPVLADGGSLRARSNGPAAVLVLGPAAPATPGTPTDPARPGATPPAGTAPPASAVPAPAATPAPARAPAPAPAATAAPATRAGGLALTGTTTPPVAALAAGLLLVALGGGAVTLARRRRS